MLKGYPKSKFKLNSAASAPKQGTTVGTKCILWCLQQRGMQLDNQELSSAIMRARLSGRGLRFAPGAQLCTTGESQGCASISSAGGPWRRRSAPPDQLCPRVLRIRGVERNLPKGSASLGPSRGRRLPRTWLKHRQPSASIAGARAKSGVPQQHRA